MGNSMDAPKRHRAHVSGFDQEMTSLVSETLFFAGADPLRFDDITSFTKAFKQQPPSLIVLPLRMLEQLDLHLMLGSDARFDGVSVIVAVDDPYSPGLRSALESCAIDYFLTSQPYHLKRLAMAVMSTNPWSETPMTSGRLLLVEPSLERRIAIARLMRIARFDVLFVDDREGLVESLSGDRPCSMVIACRAMITDELFLALNNDPSIRRMPWVVYGGNEILSNTQGGATDRLVRIGADPNPDTIMFHVQDILNRPLEDLRTSRRLPMFTPLRFQVDNIRDSVWAFTRDISLNGLFIRTLAPPPPETVVTLDFRSPTAEGTVKVGGRVAWRKEFGRKADPMKPPGMGVQFTRVSAPDGAAVKAGYNALAELLAEQGSP